LRRVSFRDPETGKTLTFLTNDFDLPAETIAAIYKARWEIELFFKTIKQNLKIKTFLGTSRNAVMTQIWIALIAYLMTAYFQFCSKARLSFQQIHRLIEVNLFQRRDLSDLIHQRWDRPPALAPSPQLRLQF
jgi:putative transposase